MPKLTATAEEQTFFKGANSIQDTIDILNNSITAKGLSIRFENVQRVGDRVTGNISINWEEEIFGRRIVIINQSIPFSVQGRVRIFDINIPIIFGISVHAYGDVFYDPPNRICCEARAEWPGGSVGTGAQCQQIP